MMMVNACMGTHISIYSYIAVIIMTIIGCVDPSEDEELSPIIVSQRHNLIRLPALKSLYVLVISVGE